MQEVDTATPQRSWTLAETPKRRRRRSNVLMLLVNFVVLHLLLHFNQWNAKREQQGRRTKEKERE